MTTGDRIFAREFGYLRKWFPIALAIGAVSGIGAVAFQAATALVTSIVLTQVTGYAPPTPTGEGGFPPVLSPVAYLIPVVTTLGGLLSGILVFGLAPEAEGHGTDAAINAFHRKAGEIRARVPIVKLVASALTIGSGGSAGREGPTAQVGAGFGSVLGKVLHLSPHDRRIAVVIGIGSGIGAIFKAPFGGAILSTEILYVADFEVEALLPGFIASTVAYSIFASVMGWTPLFGTEGQYAFSDPLTLPLFAVLGIACGLAGIVYVRVFYGVRAGFERLKIPRFVKPAIGGAIVGVIGIFVPQVLGVGYGWLQLLMDGRLELPILLLLALLAAKIVATSFSIGSGGSGGVFAPALFCGGVLGAVVWSVLKATVPGFSVSPAPFVIVGMMSFFGGVGKVPVAVILMVSEMTGTLTMLVPSMIATGIAYVITGQNRIYRSQVISRVDSPAHRGEYTLPLLQRLTVRDAMTPRIISTDSDARVSEVSELLGRNEIAGVPVLNDGQLVGIVSLVDILAVPAEERPRKPVSAIMAKDVVVAKPDETLHSAFLRMTENGVDRLPVVDSDKSGSVLGIITRGDIARAYDRALGLMLQELKTSGRP